MRAACGLLLMAVLVAPQVPAGTNAAYTLEQCVASGLARSALLANAGRDRAIAEAQIRQVRGSVLPRVTLTATDTWLKQVDYSAAEGGGLTREYDDAYHVMAGVDQLLYDGGAVRAALAAASSHRSFAAAAEIRARCELTRDIRQAFADLLLAEAAERVRAQSVTQLLSLAAQVEARLKQGVVPAFELNSARVRVANELPLLIRSQAAVDVAAAALRHVARLEPGPYRAIGELIFEPYPLTLEQIQRDALAWRPERVQARHRIALAAADLRATQGRYAPELRLQGGYQGDNPPLGETSDEWDWGWMGRLSLTWDLYDGGAREAEIAAKRLALAKAEEDYGEIGRQIDVELASLDAARRGAAAVVEATAESVQLAQQTLAIAEARYNAGSATYLEYTDAQQALRNAQLARLEAIAVHTRTVAALVCGRGDPAVLAFDPEE